MARTVPIEPTELGLAANDRVQTNASPDQGKIPVNLDPFGRIDFSHEYRSGERHHDCEHEGPSRLLRKRERPLTDFIRHTPIAISAMPAAAGPPDAARIAGPARALLLNPAWKGAVGPVVPPVVVAARLPGAIVVERPFAVGVGRFAAAGEARIAAHLLWIVAPAALEAAGTMGNLMAWLTFGKSAVLRVLCRRRCIPNKRGDKR